MLAAFIARGPLGAQPVAEPALETRRAVVSVGYEQVRFADGEAMGLVTSRFLVSHLGDWAVGPAIIGSIAGSRGGLFVFGAELGWEHQVAERLSLVGDLLVGGGGGGNAPVGSGFVWRPYLGVRWRVNDVALDLAVSHVEIGRALLSTTQLSWGVSVPTAFRFAPAAALDRPVRAAPNTGMGFDVIEPYVTLYRTVGVDGTLGGTALPASIGLIGVRAERALSADAGFAIEGAGAGLGGVAGYAEYLAHGWWRPWVVPSRIQLGVRAGIGMGGGGDVDVGGGLLVKGALTAAAAITDALAVRAEGGYVAAPEGRFRAATVTAALAWTVDGIGARDAAQRPTRTEWWLGVEHYSADRVGGTRGPLVNVVMRVNRFVAPGVYLSGQARSALHGGAGGYSAGLVGVGATTSAWAGWQLGAEGTLGAAGGGGVSTGGGAIAQGSAYVMRDVVGGTVLRAAAGYVHSLRGTLAAPVVELALGYVFGVTRATR